MIDTNLNSPEFIAFSALVTAHLMGDFVWQSDQAVKAKQAFNERAYAGHGLVHAATAYVLAANWTLWQLPVLILVVHPLIDSAKETVLRWLARRDDGIVVPVRWKLGALCLDQAAHVASLVGTVGLLPVARGYWSDQFGQYWLSAMVLVSGAILTVRVGGVVVGMLVEPLLRELAAAKKDDANQIAPLRRGFEKGGRYIGQLERTLILLFLLAGHVQGVGFLVAAKSIFRFGDLKEHDDRLEAEYIIIGTMLSFGWGLALALLTQQALSRLSGG